MPQLSPAQFRRHQQFVTSMETEGSQWRQLWRELSDNYLPQRYRWLLPAKEYYANRARRQYIINNTGTRAARVLAAGMMNGITSPSRPWFKLRVPGYPVDQYRDLAIWLEEVERRLMRVMAESNFYNSMAVLYLDMIVFGTGVVLIYEDFDSVIRCYNPPLGEYYLANSPRLNVDIFSRKFNMKAHEYFRRWPDQRYWSDRMRNIYEQSRSGTGSQLNTDVEICHFIGPNNDRLVPERFGYYEVYWESKRQQEGQGDVLELRGFNELPGIFARWELSGSDPYGVSPAMDALGDNIELQHLHRNKAELLEKTHRPPVLADVYLQNNPLALMPNGTTYVPNLNNTSGARPIYTVQPRFDQLNIDQQSIEQRIRDTFYNFLFTGVTDLPTVRSAAEIDARESEKLILLGGVLERFESEGLDPGIARVFAIAERMNLLPPPPARFAEAIGALEIQYVSTLSIAQRAVGTAPVERALAFVGNLAAVRPAALDIPEWDRMIINYFRDIGVRESEIRDLESIMAERNQREQQQQLMQLAEAAPGLAQAGKLASETTVGGGGSVLDAAMGG